MYNSFLSSLFYIYFYIYIPVHCVSQPVWLKLLPINFSVG